MKLEVKKLHPDAIIPKYQSVGAAGFDLHALEDVTLYPGNTVAVRTGLAMQIDPGFEVQIRPRSGLSLKTPLRVANSPGTIDCDYRGEVMIILTNIDNKTEHPYGAYHIKTGDRIAQGIIARVDQARIVEVQSLNETERGAGGFGSTGK